GEGGRGAVRGGWEWGGGRGGGVTPRVPAPHARGVGGISHPPHLVADARVDGVPRLDIRSLDLAARGFKDTTRIAAADPRMWQEIFQENRPGLSAALAAFPQALAPLEALRQSRDGARLEARLEPVRESPAGVGGARTREPPRT